MRPNRWQRRLNPNVPSQVLVQTRILQLYMVQAALQDLCAQTQSLARGPVGRIWMSCSRARLLISFVAVFLFLGIPLRAETPFGPIRLSVDATHAPQRILHAYLEIPVRPGPWRWHTARCDLWRPFV
jgi:hypothetical protein